MNLVARDAFQLAAQHPRAGELLVLRPAAEGGHYEIAVVLGNAAAEHLDVVTLQAARSERDRTLTLVLDRVATADCLSLAGRFSRVTKAFAALRDMSHERGCRTALQRSTTDIDLRVEVATHRDRVVRETYDLAAERLREWEAFEGDIRALAPDAVRTSARQHGGVVHIEEPPRPRTAPAMRFAVQ